MFQLDKCANCDRYGRVALEEGDTLCNLCKAKSKTVKVKVKAKKN